MLSTPMSVKVTLTDNCQLAVLIQRTVKGLQSRGNRRYCRFIANVEIAPSSLEFYTAYGVSLLHRI